MSVFQTPWTASMAPAGDRDAEGVLQGNHEPPTRASFSPTSSYNPALGKQRSTILVHQKSPLLVATPPQITRALAYSHPFLSPLNRLLGLITWSTHDAWESFLLVIGFWFLVLYGDLVVRWAAPLLLVMGLMCGMYFRRFSPLSSASWVSTGDRHRRGHSTSHAHSRKDSDGKVRHQKSLDEIVETLKMFTSRCNILLDPLVRLTDFLSTQSTATHATTRPALTTLFIRILLLAPVWAILSLYPLQVITTRRVVLSIGTTFLTWHSRPARVSRTVLWRSHAVRRFSAFVTGLPLHGSGVGSAKVDRISSPVAQKPKSIVQARSHAVAAGVASNPQNPEGIRFTFTIWENQRRWIGIGWTSTMLAYERAPWTDEELNPALPMDQFQLPEVEGGVAEWRWGEGSRWEVDGTETDDSISDEEEDTVKSNTELHGADPPSRNVSNATNAAVSLKKNQQQLRQEDRRREKSGKVQDESGWIYYDNKWQGGRYGQDGWGKYTRRRKWCRDAELIEATTEPSTPRATTDPEKVDFLEGENDRAGSTGTAVGSSTSSSKVTRRSWFGRKRKDSNASHVSTATDASVATAGTKTDLDTASGHFSLSVDRGDEDEDTMSYLPPHLRGRSPKPLEADWGVGDDIGMDLG